MPAPLLALVSLIGKKKREKERGKTLEGRKNDEGEIEARRCERCTFPRVFYDCVGRGSGNFKISAADPQQPMVCAESRGRTAHTRGDRFLLLSTKVEESTTLYIGTASCVFFLAGVMVLCWAIQLYAIAGRVNN